MSTTTIDFDTIVRTNRDRWIGMAFRILFKREDAEDAVQNAITLAWIKRDQYDPAKGEFATWVGGFVKRQALDLRTGRSKYIPVGGWEAESGFEFPDRPVDPTGGPCMAEEETRNRVEALLHVLTPRQRTAVELHAFQCLTTTETAERMGITLCRVHGLLREAHQNIAAHLAQLDAKADKPSQPEALGVLSAQAEVFRCRADLLDRLPEHQRQVVVLRYIKQMPTRKVAKQLGLSVNTVGEYVRRARRTLDRVSVREPAHA